MGADDGGEDAAAVGELDWRVDDERVLGGQRHQRPRGFAGTDVQVQVERVLGVDVEEVVADERLVVGDGVDDDLLLAHQLVEQHARPVAEGVDVEQRVALDLGQERQLGVDGVNPVVSRRQHEVEVSHGGDVPGCIEPRWVIVWVRHGVVFR